MNTKKRIHRYDVAFIGSQIVLFVYLLDKNKQ